MWLTAFLVQTEVGREHYSSDLTWATSLKQWIGAFCSSTFDELDLGKLILSSCNITIDSPSSGEYGMSFLATVIALVMALFEWHVCGKAGSAVGTSLTFVGRRRRLSVSRANAIVLLLLEGIMVRVFHGTFDCVDAHLRVNEGEEEILTVRLADLKSGLNRRFSQRIIWMRIEVSIDGDQSLLLYQQGITFLPWKLKTKRRKASW